MRRVIFPDMLAEHRVLRFIYAFRSLVVRGGIHEYLAAPAECSVRNVFRLNHSRMTHRGLPWVTSEGYRGSLRALA